VELALSTGESVVLPLAIDGASAPALTVCPGAAVAVCESTLVGKKF
jgi:hypothetical protein